MHQNPFSPGGYDYSSLERQLHQKADSHELTSLRSTVDRLERANGELSSRIDELYSRCQRIEEELGLDRQDRETAADAINALRSDIARIMAG